MTTGTSTSTRAATDVDDALARLIDVLDQVGDGDLHLATPAGGWTTAQLISHINLASLLWVGDMARLRDDPDLAFFFREEVGHDAMGYPPPTVATAQRQLASTRRSLATCLAAVEDDVQQRVVEIPDLGTMTVAEWTPLILGHAIGHVEQTLDVLRSRGALPAPTAPPREG